MHRRGELHKLENDLRRVREEQDRMRHGPRPHPGSPAEHRIHDLERREKDLRHRIDHMRRH